MACRRAALATPVRARPTVPRRLSDHSSTQRPVSLEMELRAIDGAADAKSLDSQPSGWTPAAPRRAARRNCRRATGKCGKLSGSAGEDRILCSSLVQRDTMPAELIMAADVVFAAESARQQLRAKADAQHGACPAPRNPASDPASPETTDDCRHPARSAPRQAPPEHHSHRSDAARLAACERPHMLAHRASLVQRLADLAKRRVSDNSR